MIGVSPHLLKLVHRQLVGLRSQGGHPPPSTGGGQKANKPVTDMSQREPVILTNPLPITSVENANPSGSIQNSNQLRRNKKVRETDLHSNKLRSVKAQTKIEIARREFKTALTKFKLTQAELIG
ncbi:unnamed protein product [Euphydryas editha]|uniref:Uncharacterized protein n=1 Tax=Euphydryas editha TaxID=104508 RepID=A0AAU9UKE2_EUPED|nr:unnamed protein product [Euphydryas editha]